MKDRVTKVQITEDILVSVVEWNDHEYNCQVQFNTNPERNWEWVAIEEKELSSSMQVYGYIQEVRAKYLN